jgi:hypothetical protein
VFQIRPKEGGMPYAPSRDLANTFPQLIRHCAYTVGHPDWRWALGDFLESCGVPPDQIRAGLDLAAKSLYDYVKAATDPLATDSHVAADSAGLLALPQPVLFTILAALGAVTLSYGFCCMKEAHRPGEAVAGVAELLSDCEAMRQKITESGLLADDRGSTSAR